MVSQPGRTPRRSSRDRLLAAASAEFGARGFDGARVDRIARAARVNKAMVYYHFSSKAGLYRAMLGDVFQALVGAVAHDQADAGAADDRMRRFIRAIAAEMTTRPHLPAIWLREMAEGGRHLDATTVRHLGDVLASLGAILEAGRAQGVFRPVHPLVTQMAIVAPLLLFAASAPMRRRFTPVVPAVGAVDRDEVVAYVEAATLATLKHPPAAPIPAGGTGRRRPS